MDCNAKIANAALCFNLQIQAMNGSGDMRYNGIFYILKISLSYVFVLYSASSLMASLWAREELIALTNDNNNQLFVYSNLLLCIANETYAI